MPRTRPELLALKDFLALRLHLQGKTYAEIAKETNSSVGGVTGRIKRASQADVVRMGREMLETLVPDAVNVFEKELKGKKRNWKVADRILTGTGALDPEFKGETKISVAIASPGRPAIAPTPGPRRVEAEVIEDEPKAIPASLAVSVPESPPEVDIPENDYPEPSVRSKLSSRLDRKHSYNCRCVECRQRRMDSKRGVGKATGGVS